MDKIFCIIGPTASGKTDLALELATQLPIEIVSIDSAMIYKDMDIGTAKPDPQTLAQIPHHLIDIILPTESYSVADCLQDVALACEAIKNKGKIPLLVGGTMMYFNALKKGLATLPTANPHIRQALVQETLEKGLAFMHKKLSLCDPITAARLHPNDSQRIQRALEIYEITGKPLSSLRNANTIAHNTQYVDFILMPEDRSWLHKNIELRFKQMLQAGFLAEVENLQKKYALSLEFPSMRSVGYRQALLYLHGLLDKNEWQDKAIAATRQLAKRQITWLRQWDYSHSFEPKDNMRFIKDKIFSYITGSNLC